MVMIRAYGVALVGCLLGTGCSGSIGNDNHVLPGDASTGSTGTQNGTGSSSNSGGSSNGSSGASTGGSSTGATGSTTGGTTGSTTGGTTGSTTGGSSGGTSGSTTGGTSGGEPSATWHVEGTRLLDPCGEPMVLRGVNHPTMYVDRAGDSFPEIASFGSNTVRIFWFAGNDVAISEVGPAVDRAIEEGMLPMLELHDSTCTWDLDPLVDYWTSNEAVQFIKQREGNFLLNIANEADTDDDAEFVRDYTAAIKRIRDAGIRVPLVIDGSGCGRDYPGLFAAAPALLEADPMHNVIFSAHWYDPTTSQAVTDAYKQANDLGITFIIGEFAHKSPPGCGPAVPYLPVIREADKFDIGWLAWSWGDDADSSWWNADCAEFDMTRTFNASTLERWGLEVAKTDMASIQNTSSRTKWLTDGTCN